MIVAGVLWWTAEDARDRLQLHEARLWDWVRRSKLAGHIPTLTGSCAACEAGGFPHVDPPIRVGRGQVFYRAQQLLDAEAYTAGSTRGGAVRRGA